MDSLLSCFGQVFFFFARAGARARTSLIIIALIFCALSSPAFSAPVSVDPQLQASLDKISDPKTQICLPAVDALGRSKNSSVIPGLAKAFTTEKRSLVRRNIVDALGLLRHSSALPTLTLALKDSNVQVRQSAVAALGLLGTPGAEAALVNQVAVEKNSAVKMHLAHQLGYSSHAKADEMLNKLSADSDPAVQRVAHRSLDMRKQKKSLADKKQIKTK